MFSSLRSRLVALAAGSSLAIGVTLSALGYVGLRTELAASASVRLEQSATAYAAEIARSFDGLRREAAILAATPSVHAALRAQAGQDGRPAALATVAERAAPELDDLLLRYLDEHRYVTHVRLIGAGDRAPELIRVNRTGAGTAIVPPGGLQDKGDEAFMQAARQLDPGDSLLSEVSRPTEWGWPQADRPPSIRQVHAVSLGGPRAAGYVVINADFAALVGDALAGVAGSERLTLWTQDGARLERAPDGRQALHLSGEADPDTRGAPPAGLAKDADRVAVTTAVPLGGGPVLTLSVEVSQAAFAAAAGRRLVQFLAVAAALVAAATIAAAAMARALVRPLEQLTDAVSRQRRPGDPIPLPDTGVREVRIMAGRFRDLLDDLTRELEAASRRAVMDSLTGLLNRRGFDEAVAQRKQADGGVTLILFDLDRFKQVNDRHGHEAGDAVLAEVGRRLSTLLGPGDLAARLGGDEFALLREGGSPEAVQAFAQLAIPALSRPVAHAGASCRFGVSMGAAIGPATELGDERLFHQADLALYRAKASGRGRCALHMSAASPRSAAPA